MTGRTAGGTQAAAIMRLFTDGHTLDEVLAAGRGVYGMARVLEVLRAHGITLNESGRLPAGSVDRRQLAAALEVDHLLVSAARNGDRRIADLAVHVRGDLSVLLQLLGADRERGEAARRVVLAGERAEQLLAAHEQAHRDVPHRRRADRRVAS